MPTIEDSLNAEQFAHLVGITKRSPGRPPCGRIYGILGEYQNFLFATEGHIFMAYQVPEIEEQDLLKTHDLFDAAAVIKPWMDWPTERLQDAPMDRLLAWIGADRFLKCPTCNGSGKRPVYLDDDAEMFTPDPFHMSTKDKFGWILGCLMNRHLMCQGLGYLPVQDSVKVGLLPAHPANGASGTPLLIVGDGWRFMQCPLRPDSSDAEHSRFEDFHLPATADPVVLAQTGA